MIVYIAVGCVTNSNSPHALPYQHTNNSNTPKHWSQPLNTLVVFYTLVQNIQQSKTWFVCPRVKSNGLLCAKIEDTNAHCREAISLRPRPSRPCGMCGGCFCFESHGSNDVEKINDSYCLLKQTNSLYCTMPPRNRVGYSFDSRKRIFNAVNLYFSFVLLQMNSFQIQQTLTSF